MSTLTHTGSHPVLACVDTMAEALDEVAAVEPVFMTTEEKQTALVELTRLSSRVESLKLRVLAVADDIAVETGARSTAAWLADTARTPTAPWSGLLGSPTSGSPITRRLLRRAIRAVACDDPLLGSTGAATTAGDFQTDGTDWSAEGV